MKSMPRFFLAMGFGALSALALPPVGWVILLVPGFSGLVLLVERSSWQGAFMMGWFFGLGHFITGFYWISYAFLVDAPTYGWLAPIAVFILAAGLALFPALALGCASEFANQLCLRPWARVLALAGFWTFTEWLRGAVLTGFPWNLIGSVWVSSDSMMQSVAWIGVFALGSLTVFAAGAPAVLIRGITSRHICAALSGIILLSGFWVAGGTRLKSGAVENVPNVRLRLVQPNIPQHLKWQPNLRMRHIQKQLKMSQQISSKGQPPTHVIWAETAVPFNLSKDRSLQKLIGAAAPAGGVLITGAPRASPSQDGAQILWNSAYAITSSGIVIATYDKQHLVPFGEYMPLRDILTLSKLTSGRTDFTPGTGPKNLVLPGLPPVALFICYEVIFPDKVAMSTETSEHKPAWFLNITNDAWFGISWGPYQHLAAARMRAVEHGLPVIRVANTGISAAIDPFGRVVDSLSLGQIGVLDVELARPLPRTLFGRFGDMITWIILLLTLVFAACAGRYRGS
tara:strand:+ start:79 stop:1614 length:1536 start_codon:yes stop_codon:yes gene_type:complete